MKQDKDSKRTTAREQIEYVPISEIRPYSNNPRINEAAVPSLCESIRRFGFTNPIILNAERTVINGHTRLKAAQRLGMESVPCIVKRDLSPEEEAAFRLADNRVAEFSRWDAGLLREETEMLARAGLDLSDLGLSDWDINQICGALAPAEVAARTDDELDEAPPVETEGAPKSTPGAIYQLGRHRLMCGDATKRENVEALCAGAKMDIWVTDPPYNVDYGARGKQYKEKAREDGKDYKCGKDDRRIMNDNMDDADFSLFLRSAFAPAAEALRPGGAFYVWHASRTQATFEAALNANALEVREQLIWRKDAFTLGRQDYQWKHEPCFYGWKGGAGRTWTADRKQTTIVELNPPGMERDADGNALIELNGVQYRIKADAVLEEVSTTILNFPKPKASKLHPTMKPVALIRYLIGNSSEQGANVLDTFCGSGTAVIAAEASGRTAFGMELDPRYCDVIRKRWASLNGHADDWQAATPIAGGVAQ